MALDKTCVIVIPIYKSFENLEISEKASIKRAFKIFTERDIFFIGPNHLDFSPYLSKVSSVRTNVKSKKFEDFFFKDINGYNKLLMNLNFYTIFSNYEYLLIYQPDCWVFKDELDLWCKKRYDYIGAPWCNDKNLDRVINNNRKLFFKVSILLQRCFGFKKDWRVGNGGLSLHNVSSAINILKLFNKKAQNFHANEDLFWSIYIPLVYPFFKVPNEKDAIAFAFEECPEKYYLLNNKQLPFGCHAWQKHNEQFWRQWIKYDAS